MVTAVVTVFFQNTYVLLTSKSMMVTLYWLQRYPVIRKPTCAGYGSIIHEFITQLRLI